SVTICDGASYFAGGSDQLMPGTFYDTLAANNGCDSILITQLTVLPNPMVYLGQDTAICDGTSLLLSAGPGFSNYVWNDGSNSETLAVNEMGSFSVIVTDQNGCTATDTLVIYDVFASPVNFLPADTTACGVFSMLITVNGYSSYQWSHGFTGETAEISAPGSYTLEVKDANGCTGSDLIIVEADCEQAVLMPNAFTPNGDGLNDVLKPVLLDDISDYELTIFNRWGELIFRSADPDEGWDGREGKIASVIEQYVWTVRYKNGNGVDQFEKGSVALLR
ncbi:MAG: gliding motility-associated C-terminal domain-containing protein, partial [Chitinophagales bacterium]|nr:gliding motility-associated C-terminal domain-containing protein [Chitinophagales bacterium]